jgi:hypothetical protein
MRAKELKRCLSSQSQVFSGLDENKKADKPTLNLSWVVFIAWMRARRCSPYPELFSQPDESKRAKKMLELAILSLLRLR